LALQAAETALFGLHALALLYNRIDEA
jgi:hypothetical protein